MSGLLDIWPALLLTFAGVVVFAVWAARRVRLAVAIGWAAIVALPSLIFACFATWDRGMYGGVFALVLTPIVFASCALVGARPVVNMHGPRA